MCSTNCEIRRNYAATKRKRSLNWYLLQLGAKKDEVYSSSRTGGVREGTLHDRYEKYDVESMLRSLYRDAVKRYQGDDERISELNVYRDEVRRMIEKW